MLLSASSPIGPLMLTFDEEGLLNRVERDMEIQGSTEFSHLANPQKNVPTVDNILTWFEQYAQGHFPPVPMACLNWKPMSAFQQKVLKILLKTSAGGTTSYGEIAQLAESPKAQRAVGQALTRNPFPIIVPCHRVLPKGSKGGIGGFAWGGELKKQLLEHENWTSLNLP